MKQNGLVKVSMRHALLSASRVPVWKRKLQGISNTIIDEIEIR
jgi:hypothetical protein